MSADWGQNGGYWDIYGRYSGEYNGIKIAATTGWSKDNTATVLQIVPGPLSVGDGQLNGACQVNPNPNAGGCDVGYWQSGIYVEHVANWPVRLRRLWPGVPGHLCWL